MTADARERILTCSRRLFSERTFAQVSLKDIAQEAEVSVALIVKHFHNKASLFEATVDFSNSSEALFAGPFEELGRTAIRETLTAPHNAPYSMARMITVSTGNPESLNAIGKRIRSDLQEVWSTAFEMRHRTQILRRKSVRNLRCRYCSDYR